MSKDFDGNMIRVSENGPNLRAVLKGLTESKSKSKLDRLLEWSAGTVNGASKKAGKRNDAEFERVTYQMAFANVSYYLVYRETWTASGRK